MPTGARVDAYLFPAIVGGGLGDIEEVLAAGRHLARAGLRPILYRRADRPLPRGLDGPYDWPPIERRRRLAPRAPAALTLSPSWGVSAAPSRDEPFGRGGVWEEECREIEARYGAERTLHVSLEEFARTLTSRQESTERYREGGRPLLEIRRRARARGFAKEVRAFHDAYVRFRGLDRPNVVCLYATFRPSPAFQREFPRAVQCGPLSSGRRLPWPPRVRSRRDPWVWYASPSTSGRLALGIQRGLAAGDPGRALFARSPWPLPTVPGSARVEVRDGPVPAARWTAAFRRAPLRIVTGSRTLIEALEVGGPFLYFNGVLGSRRVRRHRPEKIVALVDYGRANGVAPGLLRDLSDFSRGRRVREIVRSAAAQQGAWRRFPRWPLAGGGFSPPYHDAGALVVAIAETLGRSGEAAPVIEAAVARTIGRDRGEAR